MIWRIRLQGKHTYSLSLSLNLSLTATHFFYPLSPSPKFARKLRYLQRLDELKQVVQIPDNMIPKPVKDHDVLLPGQPTATFALNSVTPMPCVSLAFGRSLQDLATLEGWSLVSDPPVPRVVRQLIEHVRAKGK